jgi:citrate-Mg2+:H+ or citrate-Ca2+:H+ symporter, CitMHS family
MPAILGFASILVLLAVILGRKMTPLAALIAVPVATALVGGFGLKTAAFMLHGIQSVSGVAGMFIFAILYFGIMTDAGMLEPVIDAILRMAGSSPPRIVVGTALLALLVHLDGSGAVTFLVTIPVMLPLYDRLGMDRRILACAASMAAGVNFLPWTGPMIRASASLKLPVASIFNPLLPAQMAGPSSSPAPGCSARAKPSGSASNIPPKSGAATSRKSASNCAARAASGSTCS